MVASVPVGCAAPNDMAGTSGEAARIDAARRRYCVAVSEAFARQEGLLTARPGAVVVRHWPQCDADNTWCTWITAICGALQPGKPGAHTTCYARCPHDDCRGLGLGNAFVLVARR